LVWCGDGALVAVTSPGPGEGLWYNARLCRVDLATGDVRELYVPQDQIGLPAASPNGRHIAFVEAVCSDRWIVAGDLRVIDPATGRIERVDTRGVDITYTEWRSDEVLLLAGHRGFDTVVALYNVASRTVSEISANRDLTSGGRYVSVSGIGASGDYAIV